MIRLLKKPHVWRLIVLLALDALLFGSINAAEAPSAVIIAGFLLLIMTIYYLVYNLLTITGFYGIRVRHKHQASLYSTIVIGILIALQSTGELGTRDVWVLLPLVLLGYFYVTYARKSSL